MKSLALLSLLCNLSFADTRYAQVDLHTDTKTYRLVTYMTGRAECPQYYLLEILGKEHIILDRRIPSCVGIGTLFYKDGTLYISVPSNDPLDGRFSVIYMLRNGKWIDDNITTSVNLISSIRGNPNATPP
jgi:hypothetical protein